MTLLAIIALFVALERLAPVRKQKIFRPGWWTDVLHFFLNQLLVPAGVYVAAAVLYILLGWALIHPALQEAVRSQPAWLQFMEAWLVAEFCFYWVHRLAHRNRWLWRFHQIHHSSESLDFLAASRFHPVEMIVARVGVGAPLWLLGFSEQTFGGYLIFAAVQSVFVHSNIRWELRPLRWITGTPQLHHWHHSPDYRQNRNYGHPLMDALFGTLYMPGSDWPERYGTGRKISSNWWEQFKLPLSRQPLTQAQTPAAAVPSKTSKHC